MTLSEIFEQQRELIQRRIDARYTVADNGCWLWTGGFDRCKYGQFYIANRKCAAHRVSYALRFGPVPTGMLVCHRCDAPTCINPDHLFLGSALQNNADRSAKLRSHQPFGEVDSYRKLTAEDVVLIKSDARSGRALAALLGVHPNTVRKVRRGETWRHVLPATASVGEAA